MEMLRKKNAEIQKRKSTITKTEVKPEVKVKEVNGKEEEIKDSKKK